MEVYDAIRRIFIPAQGLHTSAEENAAADPQPADTPVFAVGHRVIVRAINAYDCPKPSEHFGLMAGHYGKVTWIEPSDTVVFGPYCMVKVDVQGRAGGPISPAIVDDTDRAWYFLASELEHAD